MPCFGISWAHWGLAALCYLQANDGEDDDGEAAEDVGDTHGKAQDHTQYAGPVLWSASAISYACALLSSSAPRTPPRSFCCPCIFSGASRTTSQEKLGSGQEGRREERWSRKSRIVRTIVRIYL